MINQTTNTENYGWMISCKQATMLITIHEQQSLSFKQQLALKFHLFVCKVCKLFQIQSKQINQLLKDFDKSEIEIKLDDSKKIVMQKNLNELMP
jgi:hypothetical protein